MMTAMPRAKRFGAPIFFRNSEKCSIVSIIKAVANHIVKYRCEIV